MASLFNLEVVTPESKFFEGEVEMVVVRTTEGDVGIMKNHINYVAPLAKGLLKIKKDGSFKHASIEGGFISVDKEKTTIVTDAANWNE
ncbi:ATP synthase F1 subunit epsilon [Alkalithermobacter paradoxus]|uniref:ATP synthase epsilon chain n=1 Tax=Alkalithermobacter paradoxus TaxID=29349 RepID=A0A1V4I5J8_9FIRM|nr:ATP synthase epsilon chain, sodium ion specific [[Clostridium] thermoalcaliphilum]